MIKLANKRGISLIVLVITIIIMIIIAGAVILTLSGSGVITKSRLAKEGSDFAAIREAVELGKQNMLLTGEFDKNRINIPNIYEDDIEVTSTGAILIKYNPNTKILDMANAIKILGATYISNGFDEIQSLNGETAYAGETKLAKIIIEGKSEQDIPSGYTFYDYIESTGTQYINTGVIPNNNTSVEISYSTNISGKFVFGSRVANASSTDKFALYYSSSTVIYPQYGNNYVTPTVPAMNGIIQTDKLDKNCFYHNGSLLNTFATQSFQGTYPMFLFGLNEAGRIESRVYIGRIYNCKMWNNGTLIRNMIPSKRNSDNKIGMYDLVNNIFYSNAGTGVFSTGTQIILPTRDYPVTIKSVSDFDLVSNGKNYFNKDLYMDLEYSATYKHIPIQLKPNTTYKVSVNRRNGFTGAEGGYISIELDPTKLGTGHYVAIANPIYYNNNRSPYTTGADGLLYFSYIGITTESIRNYLNNTDIQIEEGSTETAYEPYQGGKINFPYTLRSLPDGTKDYIEIDNVNNKAKLYRNVGEKVLNGSETWLNPNNDNPRIPFGFKLPEISSSTDTIGTVICSSYTVNNTSESASGLPSCRKSKGGPIIWFFENKTNFPDLETFKSWIASQYVAETPVKVQYKLETPIVNDLPYEELQVEYPSTNIYTNSIVKPKIIGQVINK